jgi:hypothetical protein
LAPCRWKLQPSIPDSRRSRNIMSRIVAHVASFWQCSTWDNDHESDLIVWFLKKSASRLAFTNRGEKSASTWSKECAVFAKWRAARATMDFRKAGFSKA